MSNETKKTALPKLRFPEFQGVPEWEEKELGKIGKFTGGGTPSKGKGDFWQGSIPWVSSSDISEDSIHQVKVTRFITEEALKESATKLVPENSILLVSRVGVGKLAITTQPVCTSQDFTNFTPAKDALVFLAYYLKMQSQLLLSFSQGMAIKGFTKEDVSTLKLFLPPFSEQQKIAATLSSLDDLITAQNAKLAALQAHKRGLMQGLFPAEGETVPKLRFPEFQEAEEWEETPLGKSLSKHPEYGINAAAVPFSNSLPTYLRITDITEDGRFSRDKKVSVKKEVTEENYLTDGDIALARTGASVGKSYKYRIEDGELVFAGFLIRVRPNKNKLNSEFLSQFLSTEQYWKWVAFSSTRSGQPGINGKEYASMPLPLPPSLEEQQKIADCLTALDNRITAQSQKIEALKLHKKGLMQSLFPATAEPTA